MGIMKETIDDPKYRRMLRPQCYDDWVEYLDFMIDFYFKVIVFMGHVGFNTQFRAQMSTSLQMMFSKGKAMRGLVCGYNQRCGMINMDSKADHTILFTLVRAAYEQLCAFELVCLIPDTEEKRIVMENVYVAAAQVNRLKLFSEETLLKYPVEAGEARKDIEECKQEIIKTQLYQSLSEGEQKNLQEQVFKKGDYQMVFTKDGKFIPHVGWDDVRSYCKLSTNVLDGVYKYACNMAHPSYLGLIQFCDAYKEGEIIHLNSTAIMQMIGIMSVFMMDYMGEFQEAKHIYESLDEEAKFAIRMYSESFRMRSS